MKFNSYPLPKISVELDDFIYHTDIKSVKAFVKEDKPLLEDHLIVCLRQAEENFGITFDQVFTASATYMNSYDSPVFYIKAEAWKRHSHEDIFVHVIAQQDAFQRMNRLYNIT